MRVCLLIGALLCSGAFAGFGFTLDVVSEASAVRHPLPSEANEIAVLMDSALYDCAVRYGNQVSGQGVVGMGEVWCCLKSIGTTSCSITTATCSAEVPGMANLALYETDHRTTLTLYCVYSPDPPPPPAAETTFGGAPQEGVPTSVDTSDDDASNKQPTQNNTNE